MASDNGGPWGGGGNRDGSDGRPPSNNGGNRGGKNRPGGDSCKGMPALSSGTISQRSKAAVTCRVNILSGVINETV